MIVNIPVNGGTVALANATLAQVHDNKLTALIG
jgi:hypothetical protein